MKKNIVQLRKLSGNKIQIMAPINDAFAEELERLCDDVQWVNRTKSWAVCAHHYTSLIELITTHYKKCKLEDMVK